MQEANEQDRVKKEKPNSFAAAASGVPKPPSERRATAEPKPSGNRSQKVTSSHVPNVGQRPYNGAPHQFPMQYGQQAYQPMGQVQGQYQPYIQPSFYAANFGTQQMGGYYGNTVMSGPMGSSEPSAQQMQAPHPSVSHVSPPFASPSSRPTVPRQKRVSIGN